MIAFIRNSLGSMLPDEQIDGPWLFGRLVLALGVVAAVVVAAFAGYAVGADGEFDFPVVVDWVDRSAYWQGRYEQCVIDGYDESLCYQVMSRLSQE